MTEALDAFILLERLDYCHVLNWRAEAERNAIASGRAGMTPEEVEAFVGPFLPATYMPELRSRLAISGTVSHWRIGADRLPLVS